VLCWHKENEDDECIIDKGKSKSYDLDPLNKMKVTVIDNYDDEYPSVQFTLKVGDSKTFTYDGGSLK
jgi:hypothetical protein